MPFSPYYNDKDEKDFLRNIYNRQKIDTYQDYLLRKMRDYDAQRTEWENDPKNRCKICGRYGDIGEEVRLCSGCHNNLLNDLIDNFITRQNGNPEYCQKCKSHVKACICPERKALNKLKK